VAEPVLICALSGRALARSARAAGMAPIVLDAFGDLDMRAAAAAWRCVPVDDRWRFRSRPLLAAAARLAPPPIPLVWGAGFERATGLLAKLAAGRPLWGTRSEVVRRAKDPFGFAAAARALGIPHPAVQALPPDDPQGWLCKRAGGAGGGHVRSATRRRPRGRGWYWQRRVPGRPVSALVIGDGREARTLGLSEQWPSPGSRRRFRFGGAVAPAMLPAAVAARLAAAAAALAAHYGIVGLASLDALVAGDELWVLELNPRPGASLDAYERAHGVNLFRFHRAACIAEPATMALPPAVQAAGSAIVHARRGLRIPEAMTWPAWAADRSPPGTRVRAGGPVCTVLATAADAAAVRTLLDRRAAAIRALVGGDGEAPVALTPAARRSSSGGRPSRDASRATARPETGP
jgi:predicted ATP-grasp superfamily ATP-dependent carboligase